MSSKRSSQRLKMAGGSKAGGSKTGSEKKRKSMEEEVEVVSGESSSRTQSAEDIAPPPPKKKTKKDPPPTPIQKKAEGSGSKKKAEGSGLKKKVSKADKGKEKATEETEKNLEKALQLYTPKDSGKSLDLDSSFFNNNATKGTWLDGFASRSLASCSLVSKSLLHNMSLNCIKMLKKSSLWFILETSEIFYPRLTRLFYINLKQVPTTHLVLQTNVAGVKFELDNSEFARIFGCPKRFDTNNHPPKSEIIKLAKAEFFLPNAPTTSKQLTHSVLKVEAKILFNILVRCIVPKEYSRELITDRILVLMYLVMHGYEVDMPKIVMEHMLFCSTDKRKHPLPYANLLTNFFKFHQIPDSNEEVINEGVGILNEKALEKIGVVKTSSKVWKLYSDLTEGELKTKKFLKPKSLTSNSSQSSQTPDLSSLMQKMLDLETDLLDLKENQHSFGMDFVQMKSMIEAVFKSTTLFHVEEEVSLAAEGSKKGGSTKELFSDHTTPEEGIEAQDKGKKMAETEGIQEEDEVESPDSGMLIKELKKKKKKKVPEIVTEKNLLEETEPEGTQDKAGQAIEDAEEESEEEAADQTGEPTP